MKKLPLLLLLLAIMPSAFAADPVTDKVSAIVHYAEQYEMGQISYIELKIYASSLREDIRELMSEVAFGSEEQHIRGVSAEAAEDYFGSPTEYTNWVWVANEEREETIDKKMPRWEKVVYDGKKIQITFNAWPQIYKGEDGIKEFYWVDFRTRFKKQFNLDIPGMQSELKSLAEQYLSTQSGAMELAEKLVEFSTKVQSYLEQNKENCQLMLEKFFSSDDKSEEQEKLVWESEIYSGKSFMLIARTSLCESCEWVWADTWFEPRFEGPGFKMPEFSGSGSGSYNMEELFDKDDAELLSMLRQELEKARQAAEAVDNGRGSFDIGGISSNVQMIHRALSEKSNWDEGTRQENKQKYISNMDSLLSAFNTEKSKVKELRYENRFVQNFIENTDKHCRQVQEEECAMDEGCIDGECRIAIGGDEDCRNNADDDGDTLIDCRDPDCAKSCGKFCKSVCEDECWPCMQQCNPVCKECRSCEEDKGGEECQEICEAECWPCHNEKCRDTPICTECKACEDANREVEEGECDIDCEPCKLCTEAEGNMSCEEQCKPCAACKSPTMNPECMDKCKKITEGFLGMLDACEDMCRKGVIFYCSGSKQYSPCDDTTYICNGNMQPIPCELFTCINEDGTERIQTVTCDQQAFCGENQVADAEKCKCRAGFYDCDRDGVNCESEEPCGGAQELCTDQKDNDDDYLVDCDDRMDCKTGMLCGLGKVCFDGACMLKEQANISAICPAGMEYRDGKCKCMPNHMPWEDECVPTAINVTCDEGYIEYEGTCVPIVRNETECPEGFTYSDSEGICIPPVPVCPEGFRLVDDICVPIVIECPEGYEAKGDICVPITECEKGFELADNECLAIECEEGFELVDGECLGEDDWAIDCIEGYVQEKGRCVSIETGCPYGEILVDGKCEIIMCPISAYYDGEKCVPKEFECDKGYILKDFKCIKDITACPPGYTFKDRECIADVRIECPEAYELIEGECIFIGKKVECAEDEVLEAGKCVSRKIFEDAEVRPEETGMQCVLAEDCGSERAVCSNGYCKEIPEEIYEREYGEGIPEVITPEEVEEEEEEKEKEREEEEGLIVPPGEEQEGEMISIPEPEEKEEPEPEPAPEPEPQTEPASNEEITGAFFKWITGFAVKEDEQCTADEECNPNQKCDKVMGRCHCEGGWFDCNGRGDGQDSDGCESEDATCGGSREICGGGCNDNQYCNEEKGWCECNAGFNDCDGNWMNGCESETRCGQCMEDEDCSAPVCADWDNVLIKFGCVEGEGWPEENAVVSFSGGCEFHPTGKVDSYLHFDAWGQGLQEIEKLRRSMEGQMHGEWCRFELESSMKERKELENGLNQAFLKWFFDVYLVEEPDKWENRMSGIFDTYWSLVDNARETARTSSCVGEAYPSYSPIDIEYESEFGKVHIWEEWQAVDEFGGINVLSPYMEIWIFPTKEILKMEMIKARELGYMPGPPEDRVKEIGPTPKEREEIKKDPEAMERIGDIVDDFGGSVEGLLTIKDGDEPLFYIKATMNRDVIFKGGPVKTVDFEPDVTVDVQLDFLYGMIKSTEQHAEIQSPPWDRSRRVRKVISNVVDKGVMFAKVTTALATGSIKIKPMSAAPKVFEVMGMIQGDEGPPEDMPEEMQQMMEQGKERGMPEDKKGQGGKR